MESLLTLRSWIALSALWIAFVAVLAWMGWPRLPMDLGFDSATMAAFEAAKRTHVLVHAGLALGPPLLVAVIGRLLAIVRGRAR